MKTSYRKVRGVERSLKSDQKELIIISQSQFGYHIDTYYYCKYLKKDFNIVYIGWDHGLPKIAMDGVQVLYVRRRDKMVKMRTWRFIHTALERITDRNVIVFIKYFKGVSLMLKLLRPKNLFVLDIRGGSIQNKSVVRRFQDVRLKFESHFFKHITVISKSLAGKLGLAEKAHILPLGAERISIIDKSFEKFDLFYVGTLFNRNLDITLHGFKQFYEEYKNTIPLSYTIVGDGQNDEAKALKGLVSRLGLSAVVKIAGRIPHTKLAPFFEKCNVGISYVPMTHYYDCQPVTKTFEYLLSGMPVLATDTSENRAVIKHETGILVGDTAGDFYHGLKTMYKNRHLFDSEKIWKSVSDFTWEKIINKNLAPYLRSL
jgi:glycosyltransferase involved in cell wall biosynthesis